MGFIEGLKKVTFTTALSAVAVIVVTIAIAYAPGCLIANRRANLQRVHNAYTGWSKITGNPDKLTFEEWCVLRSSRGLPWPPSKENR